MTYDPIDTDADGTVEANVDNALTNTDELSANQFHTVPDGTIADIDNALPQYDYIKLEDGGTFGGGTSISWDPTNHGIDTIIDASAAYINYTGTGTLVDVANNLGVGNFHWHGGVLSGSGPLQGQTCFGLENGYKTTIKPFRIDDFENGIHVQPTQFYEKLTWNGEIHNCLYGVHLDSTLKAANTSFKETKLDGRISMADDGNAIGLYTNGGGTNPYDSTFDITVMIQDGGGVGWDMAGDFRGTVAHATFEHAESTVDTGTAIKDTNVTGDYPMLQNPSFGASIATAIDGDIPHSHVTSSAKVHEGEHEIESLSVSDSSSFIFPNGNVATKTPLVVLEDTDATTPLALDTGQLSHHDELCIKGTVGGHGAGAQDVVGITVDNTPDTETGYVFTTISGGTLAQQTGQSQWEEGMYDTWNMRVDWQIQQTNSGAAVAQSPTISSQTSAHRNSPRLQFGGGFAATFPTDSVQVSTGFNAVAKLLVYGVDY